MLEHRFFLNFNFFYEGEYSADEEPPTTRNSDNKLSLKSSSSAHEVEELEPDGNNDDRIAPIEADLKTFHHKKKSAHVKLSATRGSAEGKRTQNNVSLLYQSQKYNIFLKRGKKRVRKVR